MTNPIHPGEPTGSRPRTVETAGAGLAARLSIADKLFRCWHRGMGIGETIVAIERTHRVRLPFEQVRRAFVSHAEGCTYG